MSATRWLCENKQSSSLTCIPVALVENEIFAFLKEEDVFQVRGSCFHFWIAYFGQNYDFWTIPSRRRVFALISKGRVYRNIRFYSVDMNSTSNLSPLSCLPALQLLIVFLTGTVCDYKLDTFPNNLVKLRRLQLDYYVRDLSSIVHCTTLRELCVFFNKKLDLLTIPKELVCLEKLILHECALRDLSHLGYLSCFPKLWELHLSSNRGIHLWTIPNNLSQILKLSLQGCGVRDLSPLNRLPFLEELNVSTTKDWLNGVNLRSIPHNLTHLKKITVNNLRFCDDFSTLSCFPSLEELNLDRWLAAKLKLGTLPYNLVHLKKLSLKSCNLQNVSALSRFPNLEECELSKNNGIIVDTIPCKLKRLLKLCLRECNLGDISNFKYFPDLEDLDLRYNKLNILVIPKNLQHVRIRT